MSALQFLDYIVLLKKELFIQFKKCDGCMVLLVVST